MPNIADVVNPREMNVDWNIRAACDDKQILFGHLLQLFPPYQKLCYHIILIIYFILIIEYLFILF